MGGVSYEDEWELTAPLSNEDQPRTVVLLGKTGNGKSSTGNSIIGKNAFKSKFSCVGVTTTCEMQTTTVEGSNRVINVIDTPGLFDYSGDVEYIGREIVRCVDMAKDGIHAVLVVLSVRTRFSREEQGVLESLMEFFGKNICDYMIVVFTGGDDIGDGTLDDYLCDCPEPLKETLRKCDNRSLLFDNRTENAERKSQQLQELLALVDIVVNNNDGKPYTNELFVEVKKHQTGDGEVDNLLGSSRKDMPEVKEQLSIVIYEMVETKLRATIRWLEELLAKERADRLKAEADAKDAQKKSDEEIRVLREKLKKAEEEKKEQKSTPQSGCAIL